VVVTGCYAQVSADEIKELTDVDYVVGNSHKFSELLKVIREGETQSEPVCSYPTYSKRRKKGFETPASNPSPAGRVRF
jgi:tRNA A37 methylthiotransferase MiaB